MADLDPKVRKYLTNSDSGFRDNERAYHRIFRFEIPLDQWRQDLLPIRGHDTPPELGGGGTVLRRQADYRAVPGYVVVYLTCGWSWEAGGWNWLKSRVYVTSRTILTEQRLQYGSDGTTPIVSPKGVDEKYDVLHPPARIQVAYTEINVHALLTVAERTAALAFLGPELDRNSVNWTVDGITYVLGKVLYRGKTSNYVPPSMTGTSDPMHQLVFSFMASAVVWPLVVARYIWKRNVHRVDVVDVGVVKGQARVGAWETIPNDETSPVDVTIRGEWDFGPLTGYLFGL